MTGREQEQNREGGADEDGTGTGYMYHWREEDIVRAEEGRKGKMTPRRAQSRVTTMDKGQKRQGHR